MTDESQNGCPTGSAGPLECLRAPLTEQIAALCPKSLVPGYLLGIAQGPHRLLLSHGTPGYGAIIIRGRYSGYGQLTSTTGYYIGRTCQRSPLLRAAGFSRPPQLVSMRVC